MSKTAAAISESAISTHQTFTQITGIKTDRLPDTGKEERRKPIAADVAIIVTDKRVETILKDSEEGFPAEMNVTIFMDDAAPISRMGQHYIIIFNSYSKEKYPAEACSKLIEEKLKAKKTIIANYQIRNVNELKSKTRIKIFEELKKLHAELFEKTQ